jgi:hypothetical protein
LPTSLRQHVLNALNDCTDVGRAITLHAASLYAVVDAVTADPTGMPSICAPVHDRTWYNPVDGWYTHAPPSAHEKSTGRPEHLLSPNDPTTKPLPTWDSSCPTMSDGCDA